MGIKSTGAALWNYTKSYFNSDAWHEAYEGHKIQAEPFLINFNQYLVTGNLAIVAGALLNSPTAKNAIKKPGEMAEKLINKPIQTWSNSHNIQNCTYSYQGKSYSIYQITKTKKPNTEGTEAWNPPIIKSAILLEEDNQYYNIKTFPRRKKKVEYNPNPEDSDFQFDKQLLTEKIYNHNGFIRYPTKAAGNVATLGAAVVGGAVVVGGFYVVSNAITKTGSAALCDRSVDSVKKAAVESYHDAQALGHGYLAILDFVGYCACRAIIDLPCYVGTGAWNQTIVRILGQGQDEVAQVAGDNNNTSNDVVA